MQAGDFLGWLFDKGKLVDGILSVPSVMRVRDLLLGCFLLGWFASTTHAQSIRQIQSRVEKGNWEGARQLLAKALRKDTADVELKWIIAQWFYDADNPKRQIDSSYQYVHKTLASFRAATERQRERLRRVELDETVFQAFKSKLDSAAFDRSKRLNSVAAYDYFIDHYSSSGEKSLAIELRNEVAFLEALKSNTYQSFQAYYLKYPDSHRVAEAKARYEKLLFDAKTKDGKLESFTRFIQDYPNSPFRSTAEREVFEISTAVGDTSSFIAFLHKFPQSPYRKVAVDLC
ncbi:MAG: hypothetical protein ACKOE6_08445, partial [Flammeovirgaceae bacterium]